MGNQQDPDPTTPKTRDQPLCEECKGDRADPSKYSTKIFWGSLLIRRGLIRWVFWLIRRGFSENFLGFSLDSAWVDSVGFLVACRAHSHGLEVTHGLAAGLEVTHGQGSVLGLPCLIPAGLEVTHGLGLPPGVAVPTGMSFAN
uniref:Uncharacterized protein n=1 Tax=Fagus sylvatica TaxID=28930 RepID=A0A2N9IYG9_FAGSY